MATEIIGRLKKVSRTKALEAVSSYSIEDVLSETDTNGAGTAWTFSNIARTNGASGFIVDARVISENTGITPKLTLFLFNALPTSELDDNAANTALLHADLANYIGRIDFAAMTDFGGDAEARAVTESTYGVMRVPFTCAAGNDDIYGILITQDAFTQTTTNDMTVILFVEQY
jgi:hypothetical protein